MSYSNFKYCPFCGVDISQNQLIKFCPFCGEKLFKNDQKIEKKEIDNLPMQDNLVLETLIVGNNKEYEMNLDQYNRNAEHFIQSEYYSIILKDAPNKQNLIRKLEKVLERDYFAIRLAIDNIPNIIIYKAKSDDIIHLSKIFREEQASISIVAGDFNNKPVLNEIFHTFNLQEQDIIQHIPRSLWVGDKICGIFSNTYHENKKGLMIISDKNIYFLPNETYTPAYRWFVRSYSILSKIIMQENRLEFFYKDSSITSIIFPEKKSSLDAYECIENMIQVAK